MQGLIGKFHSHLTVDCCPEYIERSRGLVGGKVTIVDLLDESSQQDVMLTHHFVSGRRGITDHHSILIELGRKTTLLASIGVRVLRTKLEYEYLDQHSRPDYNLLNEAPYAEAHIKMRLDSELLSTIRLKNWVPSFNRDTTDLQFFNRRIYKSEKFLSRLQNSATAVSCFLGRFGEVIECKIEAAIYDDAPERDEWWARSKPPEH